MPFLSLSILQEVVLSSLDLHCSEMSNYTINYPPPDCSISYLPRYGGVNDMTEQLS